MMRIFTFVAIIILMSFGESFAGTYSGGDGTVGDPYQISNTVDLIELSNTSADWSLHFILTQDIAFDADETQVDWDGDTILEHPGDDALGFSPIGNDITNFSGSFDGQGFGISNFFINRPSQDFVGLFGRIYETSAMIENLGVINVDITGYYSVGVLVGYIDFDGTVNSCYSTGSVTGHNRVGGLVGYIHFGIVNNCYSTCTVTGVEIVGGLVGFNTGHIGNSYSIGMVTGVEYALGLVGLHIDGTTNNCFWDTETSGKLTSFGGTGKTTAEMKNIATFTDLNTVGLGSPWDFFGTPYDDVANDDIWRMVPSINDGYPFFNRDTPENTNSVFVSENYSDETSGWLFTHFSDLSSALSNVTTPGTVTVSGYSHTGDVDMTGYIFIIGDDDFNLDGTLSGGFIQTPSTGRLILPAVQNVQQNFPMGDGTNNYTLKIIPMNAPTNPILVRLYEQSVPGAIQDPMHFWDIEGDDDLDATIVFRIDKSAIAPKTMNTNSILRFFDGDEYVPITEEQVTINDMGTYYEIIIINVNQF